MRLELKEEERHLTEYPGVLDPLGRTWGIRPKPVKFPHLRVHLHQPLFFHHKKGLEGTSEAKGLGEEWKRDFPLDRRARLSSVGAKAARLD